MKKIKRLNSGPVTLRTSFSDVFCNSVGFCFCCCCCWLGWVSLFVYLFAFFVCFNDLGKLLNSFNPEQIYQFKCVANEVKACTLDFQ